MHRFHILFLLLALDFVCLADEKLEIFRFKDSLLLQAPDSGCRSEAGKTGQVVHFAKKNGEIGSRQLLDCHAENLLKTDWSEYQYLVVSVINHSPEISPTIQLVLKDAVEQMFSVSLWVRANSQSKLLLPLAKTAGKLDLQQILQLQLGFTSSPSWDVSLEFVNIELHGSKEALHAPRMIHKRHDLRQEIIGRREGVQTHGSVELETAPNSVLIRMSKYEAGLDKWPGLSMKSRVAGTLNNGDFSTKTHVILELEHVDGQSGGLGFSFTDDNQKKFWNGIGSLDKEVPYKVDRMIYNMGTDLENINGLSIGCSMPRYDCSFRIKQFYLEFRPQTIYEPVLEKMTALLNMPLATETRNRIEALMAEFDKLFAEVDQEMAEYSVIKNFIGFSESCQEEMLKILREHAVTAVKRSMPSYDYGVGIADSMTSVFLQGPGFSMQPANLYRIDLARNEHESFQVVVFSQEKNLQDVMVQVTGLPSGEDGVGSQCAVVGHAETKQPQYPVEYIGYYPDFIISHQQSAIIQKNETTSFWVRLSTSGKTRPGLYQARVTVSGANIASYSFPLEVQVYDFVLPPGSPLPGSYNFANGQIQKMFSLQGDEFEEVVDQFIDLAADYKLTYDRIYYGPYTSLNQEKDKTFPRWKRLLERGSLQRFCIVNCTPHPEHTKNPTDPEDSGVLKVIDLTKKHLDYWGAVAEEHGLLDHAYVYGFDEGHVDAVTNKVFAFIKQNYPHLPIMTTAGIARADLPGLENIDIWVPTATRYARSSGLVKALRARGIAVWWYICNFPRPPEPSFMLEVPAVVPRIFMGMMTVKYRPEGFLYWAVISWRDVQIKTGPVKSGPRTNWNPATCYTDNEEGNFFVPGINNSFLPTIRVENFRDGIEDHWYYWILEKQLNELEKAKRLSPVELLEVRKALQIPEHIVSNTGKYTKDVGLLRAERQKIAFWIEKLQKLEY